TAKSACGRRCATSSRAWASAPPLTSPYRCTTTSTLGRSSTDGRLHEPLEPLVERGVRALALDEAAAGRSERAALGADGLERVPERAVAVAPSRAGARGLPA